MIQFFKVFWGRTWGSPPPPPCGHLCLWLMSFLFTPKELLHLHLHIEGFTLVESDFPFPLRLGFGLGQLSAHRTEMFVNHPQSLSSFLQNYKKTELLYFNNDFLIKTFSFESLSGFYLTGCILPAIVFLNLILVLKWKIHQKFCRNCTF